MENEQMNSELTDQQLDRLSSHVIRASQATDEVVDAAANSAFLYQRLKARMEAENITPYQKNGWRAHLSPFIGLFTGLRWTLTATAVTAAVVLLLGVFALRLTHRTDQIEVASNIPPAPAITPNPSPVDGLPSETTQKPRGDQVVGENKPLVPAIKASLPKRAVASRTATTDEEVVSDFMPLTYSGGSSEDGGQIVRVEMPRAALLALGLPVNAEITGEKLKADLLLGGDGVALAIRFVQ